jgi:hypothetical protein
VSSLLPFVKDTVPLNRISYKYLATIPYKMYILMNDDKGAMDAWYEAVCKVCRPTSRENHPRRNYAYDYSINIYNAIKNQKVANTKFCYEDTINEGQVLKRVRFSCDEETGIYYPNSGATRIASAYCLGHSSIPAYVAPTFKTSRWKRDRGVTSKYFRHVESKFINKLIIREEINALFINGVINNSIARPEFLFSVADLGIRGLLNVEHVLSKEIIYRVKGKIVLNLIPDNGFLESKISRYCKEVYTVSDFKCNNQISHKVNEYYKTNNTHFIDKKPDKYDVILSRKDDDNYLKYTDNKENFIFI